MKLAIINHTGGGISGGYKNYLQSILPRLAADPRVESILCVSPRSIGIEELAAPNEKIRFEACAPFRPLSSGIDAEMEKLLSSYRPDIIFVPTARVAGFGKVPVVTMIQNMAPLVSWEWYGLWQKFKLMVQRHETRRAVRQAAKVIAISGFVRQFLVSEWDVPEEKIESIYFGTPLSAEKAVRPDALPADWQSFVFTAGSIEPYRSLEDIVKCAEYSRKTLGAPVRILIAGHAKEDMHQYELHLKKMAREAGVVTDLCWAGQISAEKMTWCYKNCSAFVMTSRVEAGPNTVLESMNCGAVCIAADNAPLPEFYGETALYYKPGDGEMLAARVSEVLAWDKEKKEKASAAAYARSLGFTWERSAVMTVDLLQRMVKEKKEAA
ncbi:MAG: glycosyltransferase family 1 protein [Elusimicrobiales bacterium]|nr:glycosyltransferase family 1 protein [Elusimicrobiales bacterium]